MHCFQTYRQKSFHVHVILCLAVVLLAFIMCVIEFNDFMVTFSMPIYVRIISPFLIWCWERFLVTSMWLSFMWNCFWQVVLIYYEVVVIDFNLLPVKMNIINDNVGIFNINIIKAKSLKDSTFLEIVTVAISLASFDIL